uniref:E3 ubiquitin-protein ligase n=1 Tax=Bursaphelenchus xylophilus TaxID=6326 RepID=A0A1I7SMU8_BURXY
MGQCVSEGTNFHGSGTTLPFPTLSCLMVGTIFESKFPFSLILCQCIDFDVSGVSSVISQQSLPCFHLQIHPSAPCAKPFLVRMSSNSGRDTAGGLPQRNQDTTAKKRHSGHETPGEEPTSSKVRKVTRTAQACSSTSQSTSTEVSTKKSSELRFLTDFFPEQDQSRPLTRSRTRNVGDIRPSTSKSRGRKSRSRKDKPLQENRANSPSLDDQQLSNLTVPESEVSGFSVTSVSTSDTGHTFVSAIEVRESAESEEPTFVSGEESTSTVIMSSMGSQDTENVEENASNQGFGALNINREGQPVTQASQILARSQHVQRASAFLGSLVPRMQHLLGGSSGAAFSQAMANDYVPHLRIVSLLEELRSENEIKQSEACNEISEMLLLGNEESLPNFPIRELVLCLVNLINKDHNFELMLSASRCISNLQEALPRSHSVLIEAIPVLLQKLKKIEYIDVAEQALIILEVISRRNAKNILANHGVQAVTSHVDFFSVSTQRLAFQIAANCAGYVSPTDFHMVQDCLADLTQRLHIDDKRCVESVCTFFNRLIENVRYFPHRLRQIAGKNHELLQIFLNLLSAQPLQISSNTFMNIIKSLRYMITNCGDLAVSLYFMEISKVIRFLLIGNEKGDSTDCGYADAITSRPSQHLREIVDLCGELLPQLPSTGIFEINNYMEQYVNSSMYIQNTRNRPQNTTASWMFKSVESGPQNGQWVMFPQNDQLTLERNRSLGATLVTLEINGQIAEIDMMASVCRFVSSGIHTPITRKVTNDTQDQRDGLKGEQIKLLLECAVSIFPLLVEIGSSSTCSTLRYDSMRVMLRMVYAVDGKDQLLTFLKEVPLASYISNTLSTSKNLALVCLAIQMTHVLLDKLPGLYTPLFEAEGVFFEMTKRSEMDLTVKKKSLTPPSEVCVAEEQRAEDSAVGTPAVAALGRLLAARQTQPSASIINQQLGLPTVPLQNPTATLYQSLQNAVSSAYSNSVYGLNYASIANSMDYVTSTYTTHSATVSSSSTALKTEAIEKFGSFIKSESEQLVKRYKATAKGPSQGSDDVDLLREISERLNSTKNCGIEPLRDLANIIVKRDMSAFHINHSGIIPALTAYLCETTKREPDRLSRLRRFASVFMLLSPDNLRPVGDDDHFPAFNRLVSKVVLAIERVEQFNVRVTNLSGNVSHLSNSSYTSSNSSNVLSGIGSSAYLRGAQALRFFQSHQIRCNLRRHPSCKHLREWRRGRGSIKVDPFTSISAIERYLVDRGIGTTSQDEESSENDDESTYANLASFKGRIEILIGDNKLPSDMSILQAIRQYSLPHEEDDQETIPPSIWVAGHTLYYRAVVDPTPIDEPVPSTSQVVDDTGSVPPARTSMSPSRKVARLHKSVAKKVKERKTDKKHKPKDERVSLMDGVVPKRRYLLDKYLNGKLDEDLDDPCTKGLVLLRTLYGLNKYWWCIYVDERILPTSFLPILSANCFISQKLNSKVSRQLSDFLTVATQQIPKWTKSVVRSVPFAFSFITRRNFLYCTAFGRDRALMHLVNETNPDDHESESNSRLVPRLERRKITINRSSLLKSAQEHLTNLGSSKPLLEVSFDNEVGTGFGPTLEFYSTLSRELQKASNNFWAGTKTLLKIDGNDEEFMSSENGLYPAHLMTPPAKNSVKKFEFLGRLMGQTLLDSRILDIPLAVPLFKWILGEQDTLGVWDLEDLEPTIYNSLRQMSKLDEDGIKELEIPFTYPGQDNFHLFKHSGNKTVTYETFQLFSQLVSHWRLVEGVRLPMESLRKGFQQVINVEHLSIFEAKEMESLFCGSSDKESESMWSKSLLHQCIRPDHGYTHDSPQIIWLVEMLESYDREKRRKFLQFVTGSPRLPVGGFKALHPPLTVVKKTASYGNTEQELPSAMTCYNYLKIPPYESMDTFRERFDVALQYIYSFHLT